MTRGTSLEGAFPRKVLEREVIEALLEVAWAQMHRSTSGRAT